MSPAVASTNMLLARRGDRTMSYLRQPAPAPAVRRTAPPLVSGPAALASRLLSVALALAGLRAFLVRLVAFLSAFPLFAFAFALARWLARVLALWLGRCCCRRPFSVAFLLCLRRRLCC